MSDIIPNVVVSMPSQLFTLARKFQAASNGKIYIGKIDTDPTLPENQIQVYLENEDGSHIPVAQPLIINQAGFPVYNGQIAKFVTVEGHSMAVYDSYGGQQFYYPNVLKYDPDQFDKRFRDELKSKYGSDLLGFSHDILYSAATVGHKLKNSVWVTDSPFNAKMDGVTDDTEAFQKAIDSGKIVQIPTGDAVVSNLTIYPNTTIIGCGRRHGIYVTSGTQILYKGDTNTDWLTLADREGMIGDGQGGVTLKSFSCINASAYLDLPDPSGEQYYLYRPNAQKVLESNSRGLFAVNKSKNDWGGKQGWQAPKSGGIDCPFLIIDDVKLQNFTYPLDINTWMCEISNFETYMSGPIRIHGTSTEITSCWPRYPLSCAYQLSIQYSNITSSSLGEHVYQNKDGGGVELHGGELSINNCGYENIRNTVFSCVHGVISVNMLTGVTSATDRPGRLGKIFNDNAFIYWNVIPKISFSSGEQVRFSWELFSATKEILLKNHVINFNINTSNNFIPNPWDKLSGNYSGSEYIAPYVTQNNGGLLATPYITYPVTENRFREVASLKVSYKNSVLIRGSGKLHKFRVFGDFADGVSSSLDENPRQKHGVLKMKFTSYASPLANGVDSAKHNFSNESAVFSFSKTMEGIANQISLSNGISEGNDKPLFFRVNTMQDGGFEITFGETNIYDGNDKYRQCLVEIDYTGSYPKNIEGNTVSLSLQV